MPSKSLNHTREAYLQTIVENYSDGILLANQDGHLLFANRSAAEMLEKSLEELLAAPFEYPLGEFEQLRIDITRPDGNIRNLEMTTQSTNCQRMPVYLITLHDITARVQADENSRLAAKVFETTAEGIFITDANSQIILTNRAFTEITGYSFKEVCGQDACLFHSDNRDNEFFMQMWNTVAITGQWQGEIWNRRKDGEIYPEWLSLSTVKDPQGSLTNMIAVFTDISSRKQTEERLRVLATHDPLTGLPNRDLFQDRMEQALMRSRRARSGAMDKWMLAVILLDLDNFKTINDTLGHSWGDLVLIQIAERLRTCIRKSDSVARLGGDEFTIILEGLSTPDNCTVVAMKIQQSLGEPIFLDGQKFVISASIGISLYPQDGEDFQTLLKHADAAMYRAKETRGTYQYYSA